MVGPVKDAVRALHVLFSHSGQYGGDMIFGLLDVLHSDDTLQDDIGFRVMGVGLHDTGAIDEIDASHQRNVLPDFGLARDGCNGADGFGAKRVDDGGFAGVGVANETDRDLFLIRMKSRELTKQLDQGSFAERIIDGGVEGEGRILLREDFDPACLFE